MKGLPWQQLEPWLQILLYRTTKDSTERGSPDEPSSTGRTKSLCKNSSDFQPHALLMCLFIDRFQKILLLCRDLLDIAGETYPGEAANWKLIV